MSIFVSVVNQKLYMSSTHDNIVAGSQEFVRFRFNLGEEWNGLMTFAQFRQNGVAYNQYLDDESSAYLPPEIGAGTCTLMLYGSGGKTIATTNYLTLKIDNNILVSDAESTEISESLYNQLVAKVEAITSWNGQSVKDLEEKTDNIQAQVNRKASAVELAQEIIRAKAAENSNAAAIATKAEQEDLDNLAEQVTQLANNEVVAELIEQAVADEMAEYLLSGQLANLVIEDGSITRNKVNAEVEATLDKADSAMQPSVYDPQGLHVDVFAYAQGRADTVQQNLDKLSEEVIKSYQLTETLKYNNLGDTIKGAVTLSKNYAQALLADYKAFTVLIVDELPEVGEAQTFYLVPKESGNGYDKYWYITNSVGDRQWDVFGASSTVVVESLPTTGEPDVDYILDSPTGCLYYKWIDGDWRVVAGSLAVISSTLPSVEEGSEFTDYYIVGQTNGSYIHYRFINGAYRVIGGDAYTKEEINAMISAVDDDIKMNKQSIESNATNITSLSQTLNNLQQEVRNLDTEGYTYYATYGKATLANGQEADNVFTLYEVKDEQEEIKSQFVIAGGGGGGDQPTTTLIVERITPSPIIATTTDDVKISFSFSSTDSDGEEIDGTYTWKIGNSVISTGALVQGVNTFDMTEYVSIGTQKFTLTVVDEGGSTVVKSWTVQVVDVRLESSFNDRMTYQAGKAVNFTFTPYGSVSKTVHFVLDGEELESMVTTASGTLQSYALPAQEHGAHLLECYITATVNNMEIETSHIFKDIIWYDSESTTPVIGCIYRYDHYGKVTAKQYDTTNIPYVVFDPNTGSPVITQTIDGFSTTQTLTTYYDTLAYKTSVVGDHTIVISCRNTSVTIVMDIAELGIDVSPITANLEFDFNPTGLSNGSENRLWVDSNNSDVHMSVSDNFDWSNGGYHIDENGNQYFCVKAGTRAVFSYNLFEHNAAVNGSEFKMIFKTTNVRNVDATFLTCQSDSTVVGLQMDAHSAYLKSSIDTLYIPYSENDIIEFEFNIDTLDTENQDATSLIMSYEDGVAFRPMIYDSTHRLYQYAPVPITVGSDDCDVLIYRMKAYSSALTDANILSNFIADAPDSETMIARYNRNQIYNENNALTPESVAAACPDLKIIKIDCPHFTQDKSEFIKGTNVTCIHKNGDSVLDNWVAMNCYHSGQGTTSNEYGYAGRNIDILMCFDGEYKNKKITYDPNYITQLTLGDGTKYTDGKGKVSLTRNSVPNNYFNIKVNIASSENANNALLQKRFNQFLPYQSIATQNDPKVKNSMEFVNCVVFLRENDTDISSHREFNDTDWHFYAIGNIGDSKKTDNTRVNDATDPKEFVVEILDNTLPNSIFNTGVIDEDGEMVFPISKSQWVVGNPKYDSLHNEWGETYECRYEMDGISDEQHEANVKAWNDMYEWVITSTDTQFVNELDHWFIKDAALYFYLFTERYTMIDNRAKNTFWHYSKVYDTPQFEGDTGYRFDFWDYDNDTALGINNSGELTMTYGKEDIDYKTENEPSSGYIFNAAESVLFRRIRNLMHNDLALMYQNRESAGAWNDSLFIDEFDNWQSQFPEELWRLDVERKYYRTYKGSSVDNSKAGSPTIRFLSEMMNGRKRYQRRQFERDQSAYMGTKYLATSVKADQIMFRCNTPQSAVVAPDYTLHIIPYSDMYLSVLFGNSGSAQQIRAKAGQTYEIECPLTEMDDTAILIYCASRIQALNDLSACYIHDNDFSKASKLQKLVLGNTTAGYTNSFLTTLALGNNALLEELDIRNCPNLVGSINLSSCGNLERFYAEGTAITGVLFATNGKIELAHLPDTINSLTMKNLNYLTDLDVSYDNLESLTIENSIVDEFEIVSDAADTIQTLRLVGIDWTLADTVLLNKILTMNSSYLAGYVYVSGQIRNQELIRYANAWDDLEVGYSPANLVPQHLITYVNADNQNTVLYEMYVDQGSTPPDPYALGLIAKPTMASDEQYTYAFGVEEDGEYQSGSGWDEIESVVLSPRTVTAVYTKSIREYTVTWYSRPGLSLGSVTVNYGSEAIYPGSTPTNTSEESTYIFNVFAGWDKSTGFVRSDMDVYAVWDRAELPAPTKDLKDMSAGEIFAITSSGRTADRFSIKDYFDLTLGYDFDFSNVESEVIAQNLCLDGTTATTTDIQLFGENEKTFTLAIDFRFTGTETNNTLLSCYEEDGSEGFRLRSNANNPNIQWGNKSISFGSKTFRDIVVLRHIKGENKLYIYASNGTSSTSYFDTAITRVESVRSRNTSTNATISLGGIRFGDGGYDDYGTGIINWCKIWYDDLGDANARKLASWCHEPLRMEFCGAGRYRLAGNTSQRSNASFIANNLLGDRGYRMNPDNFNAGGWDATIMRTFCNTRLYDALPTVWQSMLKKVKISASAGNMTTEILTSEDYIYLASVTEASNNQSNPYPSEGEYIPWYTSNPTRAKFRGRIIPDGASYYTADSDPSMLSTNDVKEGDIWINTGNSSTAYMYVKQEELDMLGITPAYTASIGGGWISANNWWLRSPYIGGTTTFWNVNTYGYCYNGYAASGSFGVCPCFSI